MDSIGQCQICCTLKIQQHLNICDGTLYVALPKDEKLIKIWIVVNISGVNIYDGKLYYSITLGLLKIEEETTSGSWFGLRRDSQDFKLSITG